MLATSRALFLGWTLWGNFFAEELPVRPTTATAPVPQAARVLPRQALGVGRFIPDLEFTDLTGKPGRLNDYRSQKLLVIALTNASCPLCKKYAPTLARLEHEYADDGVAFLFVNPTPSDDPQELRALHGQHGFRGRYVHDTGGVFSAALQVTTTTEVFVLDGSRTLRYRGAIDDQYGLGYAIEQPRQTWLTQALAALLRGVEPAVTATVATGCALEFDPALATPVPLDFHTRIARIVRTHCSECHRRQGMAPFALEDSKSLLSHKAMIKQVVAAGTMPPWLASPPPAGTHSPWLNDRSMPAEDRADLLAWLDGEHLEGDPAHAPLPASYPEGWIIGKPDVMLELPNPVNIPAQGIMDYQYARVETNFDADRWLQAIEIRPTGGEAVHHVSVFAIPREMSIAAAIGIASRPAVGQRSDKPRASKRLQNGPRFDYIANYVPGGATMVYPPGCARRLTKDSSLLFQLHYTPSGRATRDQTQIGFIFAEQPPKHEVRLATLTNTRIKIPAGAAEHREFAQITTRGTMRVLSFVPHMHLRGKSCRFDVMTGDNTEVLLDVPRYDFYWQLVYLPAQPLRIPSGSVLRFTAWYDNSSDNPGNPDPTQTVRWGEQTRDEMLLGIVEYYDE